MLKSLVRYARKFKFALASNRFRIERILKVFSVLISLGAVVAIICQHGCYLSEEMELRTSAIVVVAFCFYVFKYFLRSLYEMKFLTYLKNNKLESVIILLLLIAVIFSHQLQDLFSLSDSVFPHYRQLFFHIFYFFIFFVEIAKVSTVLKKINMSPPLLMLLSFFVLIAMGTLLLLMPKATTNGISFTDALFTATSASCVTGLTSVNTALCFTTTGYIILMVLMQLGGMSILSFATFFISFLSHSYTGLRYQYMVKDMLSTNRVADSFSFLREIIVVTFVIEGVGALMLYMYWRTTGLFVDDGETILYSIFHAISAYNNAGFSLWPESLMSSDVVNSHFPQMIIMILVFAGGIGYVVIRDFFDPRVIRERKKKRWMKLTDGTQIALITSFAIIITGTIIFYFLEANNTLVGKGNPFDKVFASLFQVVAGRTAGFNIVDINAISIPAILLFIVIIFIGASPGSTGGGIKTTTFFVILKSISATIKGKSKIEFRKKTIPFSIVDKAYSIVVMSLVFIISSTFLLAIIDPEIPLKNLMFEATSAFTTCGLSTGCIADFSVAGKLVLTLNMYIGRIGTLTFAYALSKRVKETRHEYPETSFMVG
ncbi:MAG: hypothetical protein MJZ70_00215 [Bacteroidales bacterium]|nr:hypothetical protein [Bacteroidales bacterium]